MAEDVNSGEKQSLPAEPCLAKVISHLDTTYMGGLEVQLLRPVGNSDSSAEVQQVRMMAPFWGSTSVDFTGDDPNDYNNTQKSYGMWMVPPDVGTLVIVIFLNGDPAKGYWIGCVPDDNANFMVPGIAATQYSVEGLTGETPDGVERVPVAEYNKSINETNEDPTKIAKPMHPLAKILQTQGLLADDTRGITTSSSRREVPSSVFGMSTPGPLDKNPNAKTDKIGKAEDQATVPVSRLGGTTFVMDDGDDKFIRKLPAHQGPPEYAAVSQGEAGGNVNIPHNELVRIRTRTGHQILLHNSEDLIYIGNARGTTWIELTSLGKIDIYANDSISLHTKNDLNVTADRDINLTAVRNVNISAGGAVNSTAGGNTNIKSAGNHVETANNIHMNGPAAAVAPKATRIPQAEPWAGHENLDPLQTLATSTEASTSAPAAASPTYFKKYTTSTDPFSKISATNDTGEQA
jgi:hypothetical protein